jgi:hypothetical protein
MSPSRTGVNDEGIPSVAVAKRSNADLVGKDKKRDHPERERRISQIRETSPSKRGPSLALGMTSFIVWRCY